MPGYVQTRLAFLQGSQNKDGGWGYFPGKRSWLEPTAYVLLACCGHPEARATVERGWSVLRRWQRRDGAWQAGADVRDAHWATALAVRLHCVSQIWDAGFRSGVKWLLETTGAESKRLFRLAHMVRPDVVEFDPGLAGWPWRPGSCSWIEPTAHTILALKSAAPHYEDPELRARIDAGERMLIDRRCRDGGWNYGNRRVLGADLPSHPESTALGLLALQGNYDRFPAAGLDLARRLRSVAKSPLAKAWLTACLSSYGDILGPPDEAEIADVAYNNSIAVRDVMLAAIEILAYQQVKV